MLANSFLPNEQGGIEMPDGRILKGSQMWLPNGTVDPQFTLGGGIKGEFIDFRPLADGKFLVLFTPPFQY
jgi:hypothetical protein